jgi:hypothetical protein
MIVHEKSVFRIGPLMKNHKLEVHHRLGCNECQVMHNVKARKGFFWLLFDYGLLMTIMILSVLTIQNVAAQKADKPFHKSLKLQMSFGPEYDSNILKYSDTYIEKFKSGHDKGRFHTSTYDGIILRGSVGIAEVFQIFNKRETEISLDFTRREYLMNSIKTWNSINTSLAQDITRNANIELFYNFIPYFYVRHYRDDDWVEILGNSPETYQAYSFSKENFGMFVRYSFPGDARIRFMVSQSNYFYNEHFTEYDSRNYSAGLRIYHSFRKKNKTTLGLQFESSKTKDLDPLIYTLEYYPDASYKSGEVYVGFIRVLPQIKRYNHQLELSCNYEKRIYTSSHYYRYDPIHSGRVDDKIDLLFEYQLKINKNMILAAYYKHIERFLNNSIEENKTFLKEEKAYSQNQAGIQFTYVIQLKKKQSKPY